MPLFKKYLFDFFCLFFPDLCNACGTQLFQGEKQICSFCLHDLPYTDFQLYKENPVAKLFWGRIQCDTAMAMLYFNKGTRVQKILHQLKYKSKTDLCKRMGMLMAERIPSENISSDFIVPVPLHYKKEKTRGYNQSNLIAEGMAQVLRIPVNCTLLLRRTDTKTQTRRNRYNRFENMRSVFYAPFPSALQGKNILLVDDVITTGATLEACSLVLLECGINELKIAALAFTE